MQAHFPITDGTVRSSWGVRALHHIVTDWVAAGKLSREEEAALSSLSYQRTEAEVWEALRGVEQAWEVRR